MPSIRSRLLLWLLILFSVIWVLVTLVTYLESRHEVEELFDAQLAQSAAVLSEIGLSSLETGPSSLEQAVYGHPYEKKIAFQIWSGPAILRVTLNALYPLSLALPALALLVWLGIGRGLAPLSRIAGQVAARSSDNLDPVAGSAATPQEVRPLIAALDDLFARL